MPRPHLLVLVVCIAAIALPCKAQNCAHAAMPRSSFYGTDAITANILNNIVSCARQDSHAADPAYSHGAPDPESMFGSKIDFLVFVSDADMLPTYEDEHFKRVVVPVTPGTNNLSNALALLAQHRAQFMLSVGNRTDFKLLDDLPAQVSIIGMLLQM